MSVFLSTVPPQQPVFPTWTSELLQALLITQFQSCLHTVRYLIQQYPTSLYQDPQYSVVATLTTATLRLSGLRTHTYFLIVLEARGVCLFVFFFQCNVITLILHFFRFRIALLNLKSLVGQSFGSLFFPNLNHCLFIYHLEFLDQCCLAEAFLVPFFFSPTD